MRDVLLFGCVVVLSACASNRSVETAASVPQGMRVTTNSISSISTVEANTVTIPYTLDRVWSQLPAIYEEMGIPVGTFDMPGRTMGNTALKLRRQLGKVPLSRYLECGSAQGTASADSYEVYMSILSKVTSVGTDSTTLVTTIEAQARPTSLAGQFNSCASKHTLEKAIADKVKIRGP